MKSSWNHRSENLHITWDGAARRWDVEIRFPSSLARGSATGTCPRCGGLTHVEHWQLEGPDGPSNSLALECAGEPACAGADGGRLRWQQTVNFPNGWTER